jgi:hypothetical protein
VKGQAVIRISIRIPHVVHYWDNLLGGPRSIDFVWNITAITAPCDLI